LITIDLNAAPTYATISYVWGDLKKTVVIKVDGNDQPVTINLRDILCRIRQDAATTARIGPSRTVEAGGEDSGSPTTSLR
jgi:hypothetical protein